MKQNLRVRISRLERGASRQSEGVEAAPRWLAGLLKTDARALESYAQLVGAGQPPERPWVPWVNTKPSMLGRCSEDLWNRFTAYREEQSRIVIRALACLGLADWCSTRGQWVMPGAGDSREDPDLGRRLAEVHDLLDHPNELQRRLEEVVELDPHRTTRFGPAPGPDPPELTGNGR